MRELDATQQTSPVLVSKMSVETIHPPNEHDTIFKQLDKHVCRMRLLALFLSLHKSSLIS